MMIYDMEASGKRLKELRLAHGETQKDLAKCLEIGRTTVSEYESGKKNLTDRTIADICREFNVNEQWLRAGEGPMFKQQDNLDNMLTADVAKLVRSSDEFTKKLIHNYLSLPQEARDEVKKFILKLAQEDK